MDPRLYDAARRGDTCLLQALLQEDSLVLERGLLAACAENALHIASMAGHSDFAKAIIKIKPQLATKLNKDGFSPIHMASANGHVEIVRELLKINSSELGLLKSSDGRTPLHCATTTGSIDVIRELLLKCPESARELATIGGETPFHLAVKNNQLETLRVMVQVLKQQNFLEELLNAKDEEGNTVLYLATSRKQAQTIRLLLGGDDIPCGMVDVNVTNKRGLTAMDVLDVLDQNLCEPSNNVIRELIQRAGAVKAQDNISPVQARPILVHSPSLMSLRHPWKFWKALAKEVEDSTRETQNSLMVVAVLITTVTYQAILSPPGGLHNSDGGSEYQDYSIKAGSAIMSDYWPIFIPVIFLNSVGYFASLAVIILLTRRFPLKILLRLAVISMAATYVCVVVYIAPTTIFITFIVAAALAAVVFVYFIYFMVWLMMKIRGRVASAAAADETQVEA